MSITASSSLCRPAVEKNRWTVRRPGVNCLMFVTPGLSPPRRIQDSSDEERKMFHGSGSSLPLETEK